MLFDRLRLLSQAPKHFLSHRSHEPKDDNPVPRGYFCHLRCLQVGLHVLHLQLDFSLPCQVCFYVFLSRLDPRTVHQDYTVLLDYRGLSCYLLDLCNNQLCSYLSTLRCKRRSVGPWFIMSVKSTNSLQSNVALMPSNMTKVSRVTLLLVSSIS